MANSSQEGSHSFILLKNLACDQERLPTPKTTEDRKWGKDIETLSPYLEKTLR